MDYGSIMMKLFTLFEITLEKKLQAWSHGSGKKDQLSMNPAFEKLLDQKQYGVIVSVGSGFGVTEKKLEEDFNVTVTTIDPLEGEYGRPSEMKTAKMPEFKDVDDYIEKTKPSGPISVILDWSYPNDDSTYDVECIQKLKPAYVLVRYASCGAAGSSSLHTFLGECGCKNDGSEKEHPIKDKYRPIYSKEKVIGTGSGFNGTTINVVLLKRE